MAPYFDPNNITKLAQRLKAQYKITGKAIFVNNNSVPVYGGKVGADSTALGTSEMAPLATIDFAVGLCLAGRGDAIFALGGHSETVTAAIAMDVAGVQLIGVPLGNKRPKVIVNGAIDALSITAANCSVQNIEFGIVTTDAATAFVNVAAAYAWLDNLYGAPSATSVNVVDVITLASGADDCLITNCDFRNTTVPVNSFLSIEAAVARLTLKGNFFFGNADTAGIIDGAAATLIRMENNTIGTIGTTIPAVILDSNPTGVVDNNRFYGTSTTIANNAQLGNAVRQSRSYVLEETDNSKQATNIIPALDTE